MRASILQLPGGAGQQILQRILRRERGHAGYYVRLRTRGLYDDGDGRNRKLRALTGASLARSKLDRSVEPFGTGKSGLLTIEGE
jgi:hypothetical protein